MSDTVATGRPMRPSRSGRGNPESLEHMGIVLRGILVSGPPQPMVATTARSTLLTQRIASLFETFVGAGSSRGFIELELNGAASFTAPHALDIKQRRRTC
jgi:hypothetical protein